MIREKLIADYVAKLGGNVGPIAMTDVERCADMVLLAQTARAKLAAGRATINDVVKLENAADRAVRRLNLPEPGPSKISRRYGKADPVPTLQDYFANQQGEDE